MAQQEASSRPTRAAKRRAATAISEQQAPTKKRVVLGELNNLSNVVAPVKPTPAADKQNRKFATNAKIRKPPAATVRKEIDNIDVKSNDPRRCLPYASDIYEYLRKMEVDPKRRPLPNYIEKIQKDLNPNMRGILVDWLVEVAEEYNLVSDTLYLSISYIDSFLSLHTLNRQRLQLLGVSSMLIASKYEEINPPHVEDFCYITDNTYTKEEVVNMEADMLECLKFELGNPTVKTFLRRYLGVAQEGHGKCNLEFLSNYLAELSLLDYSCVKFLPSLVASAVIFVARFIQNPKRHPWDSFIHKYAGYKPAELKECVLIIHDLYLSRRGGSLQAVRGKYKQHKFKSVATMPSPPEIPVSYFEDDVFIEA